MFLLDQFTLEQLRHWRIRNREVLDFHWDYYSCLAQQRARVYDALKAGVACAASPYEFRGWRRIVDYRLASDPLSASGSIEAVPGGRFNIGNIDVIKFPRFPALYLASDFATAFREKFGIAPDATVEALTAHDLALADGQSLVAVAVEGSLQIVLDLRDDRALEGFASHISGFRLPSRLRERARKLGLGELRLVRRAAELRETVLAPEWRATPVAVDVPSNSQVLAQIVHAAALEGVLYPSARGGGFCLAVYPHNILPGSHVQIAGEVGDRPAAVANWRLDHRTKAAFA